MKKTKDTRPSHIQCSLDQGYVVRTAEFYY